MYLYDNDMDWIFAFCKICWEYNKIIFNKVIDFQKDKILNGRCINCKSNINFDIQKIKKFYSKELGKN